MTETSSHSDASKSALIPAVNNIHRSDSALDHLELDGSRVVDNMVSRDLPHKGPGVTVSV